MDTNTTLYLVRHGTTDLNAELKYQGLIDPPLNALGRAQGALLTGYFAEIPIDVGVTSPLLRARQTLDFMLGDRKDTLPVVVEEGLHEIDLGVMDGRPVTEASIFFPEFQKNYVEHPGRLSAPGGETAIQVYNRMRDTILRVAREYQGKTVAMASHGFAIQTWLNYASGIPAEEMKEWGLGNVAVSKFTFNFNLNDGQDIPHITIDYIGDERHLSSEYRCNYDWEKLNHPAPLFLYDSGCDRCRRARSFLDRHRISYQERDLASVPLRKEELLALMERHDGPARDFMQVKSRENTPGKNKEEDIASRLSENAAEVKHPLFVKKDSILLGFGKDRWSRSLLPLKDSCSQEAK